MALAPRLTLYPCTFDKAEKARCNEKLAATEMKASWGLSTHADGL